MGRDAFMFKLCRLLLVALLYVAWIAVWSAIPAVTVYGQGPLRELTLPPPPDGKRPSIVDQQKVRSRVRSPFVGKSSPEFVLRSAAVPIILPWIGTDSGFTFQMAGLGPTVKRVSETPAATKTFTTDFPLTERPISENGVWRHLGTSWAYVRSVANHAVGTQTGSGGYDDSYAYLTGFGPDQTAQATLWIDPAIGGDYREVELLLRWADSPTSVRGYECNLSWNGSYAQIVRWNGPYGDFTYVTNQTRFNPGIMPPMNGDIFKASISGSTIHVYLNKNDGKGDQLIVSGRDRTFANGDPGMGFFIQGSVDPAQFGFSSYTASSD